MPTSTVENYLKAIQHLGDDGAPVTIGRIAAELQVTPGTVTTMMKQLGDRGLVSYAPRRGVRLSRPGREAALRVLRRHRLLELFLVEVLKLDWGAVHAEAEILEHAISDRLLERIDDMLGHPTCDPHGAPIPDARGRLPKQVGVSLADCPPGRYRLLRVNDTDTGLLDWLARHGLRPGTRFDLLERDQPAGILHLRLTGRRATTQLGATAAGRLLTAPAR
jgi:DtxR family Mn-dependent transcriptional regulator